MSIEFFSSQALNLAYMSAQLNSVSHLIQAGNCVVANVAFMSVKRTIRLHAKSLDLDAESQEGLNRTIARLNRQLEWGMEENPKFKSALANRCVDELLMLVTEWEGDIAGKGRKEIISEDY